MKTKALRICSALTVLCLLISGLCCAVYADAPPTADEQKLEGEIWTEVALTDGGAENTTFGTYWNSAKIGTTFQSSATIVNTDCRTGTKSFKISSTTTSASAFLYQDVSSLIRKGKTYIIEAYIKTDSIVSESAGVRLVASDSTDRTLTENPLNAVSRSLTGTNDWQRVAFRFSRPEDVETVYIGFEIIGATGTAYIDDVAIHDIITPDDLLDEAVRADETPSANESFVEIYPLPDGGAECTEFLNWTAWSKSASQYNKASIVSGGYEGEKCFEITSNGPLTSVYHWLNLDKIKTDNQDKQYVVEAYIKTKDVIGTDGRGANLTFSARNKTDEILLSVESRAITGTKDWQRVAIRFKVPKNTNAMLIGAQLNDVPGTLYVDRFKIYEVREAGDDGRQLARGNEVFVKKNNVVLNGGGESDTDWKPYPETSTVFSFSTSVKRSGNRAFKASADAVEYLSLGSPMNLTPLTPIDSAKPSPKEYAITFWAKTDAVSGSGGLIGNVANYTAAYSVIDPVFSSIPIANVNEWTQYAVRFTPHERAAVVNVYFEFVNATGTAYFDDIEAYEVWNKADYDTAVEKGDIKETLINRTSLLTNPDGETGALSDCGWTLYPNDPKYFSFDTSEKKSGNRSFKINVADGSYATWFQYLDIKKMKTNTWYVFTVWVKTENVAETSGRGADVTAISKNAVGGQLEPTFETDPVFGTNDWEQIKLRFQIHPAAGETSIGIRLNYTNGTVWFDNAELFEVSAEGDSAIPSTGDNAFPSDCLLAMSCAAAFCILFSKHTFCKGRRSR